MKAFLRENWLWIFVPLLLVVAAGLPSVNATGDKDLDPFICNLS